MSEQPSLPPRSKPRGWISVLAALLLLVSGGVIGGVVGALVVRDQVIKAIKNPEVHMLHMSNRMRAELDLTDEQHDQIREILDRHHTTIRKLREEIFENISLIQQEVEEVLTPEQIELWKRRIDKLDHRGMGFRRFDRHGPAHRPGGRGPLADVDALFERSDRDRDGRLTIDEFSAGNEPRAPRMFSRLDADGDGYATREEIELFKQEFPRGPRRRGMDPSEGGRPGPPQP